MDIVIPIYDGITALDAVGPYDVLSRVPDAQVHFAALETGPKRTENGMLALVADRRLAELERPEIVVVPGGYGSRALMREEDMLRWLREAHEHTRYTTSVCTGALLLGAAGLLDGLEATTHWAELGTLGELGATPVERRVVEQGKVITAAGVSSGIDMALTLVARLYGDDLAKGIQLGIEYDPEPPFDAGSTAKAGPELTELVRAAMQRENEEAAARL